MISGREISASIGAAIERRAALEAAGLGCYRLFHGYGEGIDGLAIDRYGDAAVIRYRGDLEPLLDDIAAAVPGRFSLVTARQRGFGHEPRVLRGELPAGRVVVSEGPHRFLVDYSRAGNPGLYLDARPARRWLRDSSADRRVLNLFSFTGSLGIAAAAGGASSVIHVDSHGPTLAWAKANCIENGLDVDDRDFARINVYQHLRKTFAKRKKFGGIVLDPPPGPPTPGGKDRSPGQRGVAGLAPLATEMLEPGGWLLCFFHHDARTHAAINDEIASSCDLEVTWQATSGEDFPEADETSRLRLTAFVKPAT